MLRGVYFLCAEVKKYEPDIYRDGILKSVLSWDKYIISPGECVVK
jgi:hypothetical protein